MKGQRTVAVAAMIGLVIRLVFRNRTSSLKTKLRKISPVGPAKDLSVPSHLRKWLISYDSVGFLFGLVVFPCLFFFLNQNHKLAQITYSFNRHEKGVCVCVCVCVY